MWRRATLKREARRTRAALRACRGRGDEAAFLTGAALALEWALGERRKSPARHLLWLRAQGFGLAPALRGLAALACRERGRDG